MRPMSGLRKWREAESRPIPGNSPNDRIQRGPDCYRHKRVCVDLFPATPQPRLPGTQSVPGMRFSGMTESIGPMWSKRLQTGAGVPPPVGRPRCPAKGRDGRGAPYPSFAMSSGRLFLDRVARQQSPSPLHRQPDHKTLDESEERIYHRTVTAAFPSCLTRGVHPIYLCLSVFISGRYWIRYFLGGCLNRRRSDRAHGAGLKGQRSWCYDGARCCAPVCWL
jgi:hypothetical protein